MYFGAELWREGKSKNPLLFPDTLSYLQTLTSEVIRRNGSKGWGGGGGRVGKEEQTELENNKQREQEWKWKGKLGKKRWY